MTLCRRRLHPEPVDLTVLGHDPIPGGLFCDRSLNRLGGHGAHRAPEIAPRPERRHPEQLREFLPEQPSTLSFESPDPLIRCPLRGRQEKQVQMVGHDLQGQDLGFEIGGRPADDPDEPIADRADQDLAAFLGTLDQVVVDEKDAGFFVHILFDELMYYIIMYIIDAFSTHRRHTFHHLKGVGFRLIFCKPDACRRGSSPWAGAP